MPDRSPGTVAADVIIGFPWDTRGGGGGAPPGRSAGEKRDVLRAIARKYGTDSPEWRDYEKRWPKQARKVLRDLPRLEPGGANVIPTSPLSPVVIVERATGARGVPYKRPSLSDLWAGLELSLTLSSVGGLASGLGKRLLAALLKKRAKKQLGGSLVDQVTEFTKLSKSEKLAVMRQTEKAEAARKIAARAAGGAGIAGGAAIAVKELLLGGKASRSSLAKRIATAGTIAAGALTPGATPKKPGASSSSSKTPTGSRTSSRPVGPGGAPAGSQTAATAQRVQTSGAAAAASIPTPGWANFLGLLAPILSELGSSSSSGRKRLELPDLTPTTSSITNTYLTPFGAGGVGSGRCECKPKPKKRGERKRRTVCYTGRFTETATGTVKYEKRRRQTCLPSRKKPPLRRAS